MPKWRRLPRQPSIIAFHNLVRRDLVTAFMLLTRLPVWRLARPGDVPDVARCVWAFPVVGVVVNGIGSLVYWLAYRGGIPPLLAAAWALAATVLITGGLHEDGLADTADGFGGGAAPERKLDIMRDSRMGSYGALALVLSMTIRAAAIAALNQPGVVSSAMIAAGISGRGGMLLLLLMLKPARPDGLGASLRRSRPSLVALGVGLTVAASLLWLPTKPAVEALVLALGCTLLLAKLAHGQIGGYTGDVLGACEVAIECVVLTALVSALRDHYPI